MWEQIVSLFQSLDIKQIVAASFFLIAIIDPLGNMPVTIMYVVISGGLVYVLWQFPSLTLSLLIFMGISIIAAFYSIFLKRIFEKLGAEISFRDKEGDGRRD